MVFKTAARSGSSLFGGVYGSKRLHCIGAIDTPKQGGTASGSSFRNHGWVLTPQPNQIPTDGSTINIYVDGVYLGHPVYNVYRSDIAALFPGYANSSGAHAYFDFDTTAYKNGLHTIYWTAEDDAGNIDGIGSRYFTIQNSKARAQSSLVIGHWSVVSKKPVGVLKGYKTDGKPQKIYPDKKGNITIEIKELEPLEVRLFPEGAGVLAPLLVCSGFHIVGSQLRPLPIGSTLETKRGIFYWHPGPGFIGNYELVFIVRGKTGKFVRKHITIKIGP